MLIDSYLAHLTLRNARPNTIRTRRWTLEAFARELEPRHLTEATRADVERYLSRPLAAESRRAYRSTLKGFYAWAVEENYAQHNPTEKVPAIRVRRGVPRPIDEADLRRALDLADRRMRAWLLLMALCGLRCMEVSGLEPRDLVDSPAGPLLHLRVTKGGQSDTVPLHPDVIAALAALPIRNGLWWTVNADNVSRAVNAHLRRSGVRSTAHSLRHFAGTSWYSASGHDLLATAALLRHRNVSTTAVYARLSPDRAAEVARSVRLRAV